MLTQTFCLNTSKCFIFFLELFKHKTLVLGIVSLVKLEIFSRKFFISYDIESLNLDLFNTN